MEEAALRCPCPCTPERRLCSEKPRGFGADPTSGGSWGRQGEQALLLKGARGFRAAELAGTRLRWAQMTISQGLISAPVIRINTPLPGEALPARTTGFVSRAEPFLSQSLPPTPAWTCRPLLTEGVTFPHGICIASHPAPSPSLERKMKTEPSRDPRKFWSVCCSCSWMARDL